MKKIVNVEINFLFKEVLFIKSYALIKQIHIFFDFRFSKKLLTKKMLLILFSDINDSDIF